MPKLNLPREFVLTQFGFAQRMAEVSGDSLEDALIEYTGMRTLMNVHVTRETAQEVPEWRAYIDGLIVAEDPEEWTYTTYLKQEEGEAEPADTSCFRYTYPFRDTSAVRLHFANADRSGKGALSTERAQVRCNELKTLLKEVHEQHPDAKTIRGGSWLYNITAYRRLFPPAYIESAEPVGYELPFWALWGQFLRGGGKPNLEAIQKFRADIGAAATPEKCVACFPYEVLRPECSIEHFYTHFGI